MQDIYYIIETDEDGKVLVSEFGNINQTFIEHISDAIYQFYFMYKEFHVRKLSDLASFITTTDENNNRKYFILQQTKTSYGRD